MAETLGERIASLRKAAGLSQSQLAGRAGVSTGTLKNWEQGIRMPLPAGLAAIAKGLGVSPGPLLEGVSFPAREQPPVTPSPAPGKRKKPSPAAEQAPALDQGEKQPKKRTRKKGG